MCFPLFKLYACHNVTKYALFLFDLAKYIFYRTVLFIYTFYKVEMEFNWDLCETSLYFKDL